MSVNTTKKEQIDAPIITGTYSGTPVEISQILDGGVDFLNRKLAGKTLEQQVKILEKSGYIFEQKSGYTNIKHYIKKEEHSGQRQVISTSLRDELVSFGGDYFAEEICAAIQQNPTILKGFYIKRNGKWYLYDIGENYRVTGETFLSDISVQNPEGFDTIDELNISFQNQKLEKELAGKGYQDQLVILKNNGFTLSSRQTSIDAIVSLSKKEQKGEKKILVDQKHKQLFSFDGIYAVEDLYLNLASDRKPIGITLQRNGRWFYYPLKEKYSPNLVILKNPNTPDGGFADEDSVYNFLRMYYTSSNRPKN